MRTSLAPRHLVTQLWLHVTRARKPCFPRRPGGVKQCLIAGVTKLEHPDQDVLSRWGEEDNKLAQRRAIGTGGFAIWDRIL